jgi:transcriptional regulator with XRE-family HTH domain
MSTHKTQTHDEEAVFRTMRDFILEASPEELNALAQETGLNLTRLAGDGREAVHHAMDEISQSKNPEKNVILHKGLSSLVVMLRRRDALDEAELAKKADVDESEIRRIEYDSDYSPGPRTIYKLEQAFKLPGGVLAKLAGAITTQSSDLEERVEQFAANAKSIGKLTLAERQLLNAFVKFLAERSE